MRLSRLLLPLLLSASIVPLAASASQQPSPNPAAVSATQTGSGRISREELDKLLPSPQPSDGDPMGLFAAGIRDVEFALDRREYVQALIDYEALRAGSSAIAYRRRNVVNRTTVGRNPFTGNPSYPWTPEYWWSIRKERSGASAEEVPFVREYLQRTSLLYSDLKIFIDEDVRLTLAMRKALSEDPESANADCDAIEQIQSRIAYVPLHEFANGLLAQVKKAQEQRERAFRESARLAFHDDGSSVRYEIVAIGPDGQKRSFTCGDKSNCIIPRVTGAYAIDEGASLRLQVRFNLQGARLETASLGVPKTTDETQWPHLLVPGADFDFAIDMFEVWPRRTGVNAFEHGFSPVVRIDGKGIVLPDYSMAFTESVRTSPTLSELVRGTAYREYTLGLHIYREQAGEFFKNVVPKLAKDFPAINSIQEMTLEIAIKGLWQTVAPPAAVSHSSSPQLSKPKISEEASISKAAAPYVLLVYEGPNRAQADKAAKDLLQRSMPAFVISNHSAEGERFQVRVGPFATSQEMEAIKSRIEQAGVQARALPR